MKRLAVAKSSHIPLHKVERKEKRFLMSVSIFISHSFARTIFSSSFIFFCFDFLPVKKKKFALPFPSFRAIFFSPSVFPELDETNGFLLVSRTSKKLSIRGIFNAQHIRRVWAAWVGRIPVPVAHNRKLPAKRSLVRSPFLFIRHAIAWRHKRRATAASFPIDLLELKSIVQLWPDVNWQLNVSHWNSESSLKRECWRWFVV